MSCHPIVWWANSFKNWETITQFLNMDNISGTNSWGEGIFNQPKFELLQWNLRTTNNFPKLIGPRCQYSKLDHFSTHPLEWCATSAFRKSLCHTAVIICIHIFNKSHLVLIVFDIVYFKKRKKKKEKKIRSNKTHAYLNCFNNLYTKMMKWTDNI